MQKANPYNYNLAVSSDMFFGRQKDVDAIAGRLTIARGDSFALIGGRRMGKTSFLEALMRRLAEPIDDLLPLSIYLDLNGQSIQSVFDFFCVLTEQIQVSLSSKGILFEKLDLEQSRSFAPLFARRLDDWSKAVISCLGLRLRIIVLLDECEKLTSQSWTPELYSLLRYLISDPITRSLFKLVMAGSHRFTMEIRGSGSPLHNALQCYRLSVLDAASARSLVTQPIYNELPTDVVDYIVSQSGGHPFLTQYIMYHLYERGLKDSTLEMVDRVVSQFQFERMDFRDWMRELGDLGDRVYGVLAKTNDFVTEEIVKEAVQNNNSDFVQILDALCYHGLVVMDEATNSFRVAGNMFRFWYLHNYSDIVKTKASISSLQLAVARLQTEKGLAVGTGFVITNTGLIITSAHVIDSAGLKPGQRVYLQFYVGNDCIEAEILEKGWHPLCDVSFLQPLKPLPKDVRSVVLDEDRVHAGTSIIAFGYPAIENNGLWGDGRLVGYLDEIDKVSIQLYSSQITKGFSGGPVAVSTSGKVIGMIEKIAIQDSFGKSGYTAIAISSETLAELIRKL